MKRFYCIPALMMVSAGAIAGNAQWYSPSAGDLHTAELTSGQAVPPSRHTESTALNYTWPLSRMPGAAISADARVESRQYWVDTTGDALARGIKLPLSAPGAVIRVSALEHGSALTLNPQALELSINGLSVAATEHSGDTSQAELVSGSELRAQGMPVPQDSLAFRLPETGAAGTLHMRLAGAPEHLPLVVHVYEPFSPWTASLSAPRHNYLSVQSLNLELALSDGQNRLPGGAMQALLVSPNADQAWPLEVGQDGFTLHGPIPTEIPDGPGLFEVHAYVNTTYDDTVIRRDLKLALGISTSHARFSETAEVNDRAGLAISLGVEAAVAGRYQVNAEVHGTDALGHLQGLAMVQSAAVLDAGDGRIRLDVPADLLIESGLQPPYEIRNLELLDQGRMQVLESRQRAMKIDTARTITNPPSGSER